MHVACLQAKEHGHLPADLIWTTAGMLVAAFFPPTARVLGFASGIVVMLAFHYQKIMTINLVVQLAMYLSGGVSFLRYAFDLEMMLAMMLAAKAYATYCWQTCWACRHVLLQEQGT